MRNKRSLTGLFLSLLLLILVSCSDDEKTDDEIIKVYVPENYLPNFHNLESVSRWVKTDKIELKVGQIGLAKIEGGNSQYNMAQSQDTEIAEVLPHPSNRDVITIACEKIGETTISLKSKTEETIKIPLVVEEYKQSYFLCRDEPDIIILAGEKEPEDVIKKAITEQIKEQTIFKGYLLDLIYDTPKSGKVEIYDSKEKKILSGTFEEEKDTDSNRLEMDFDGKKHHFTRTDNPSEFFRSTGPKTTFFIEDQTQLFQTDYPGITEVTVITGVCE